MPKRAHAYITTGKRKRGAQDWINAQHEGNMLVRHFRIARGESGLRIARRRHSRATWHSGIVTMGDTDMEATVSAKRKRQSEAKMIPGLGPLEYGFPNSVITTLRYCKYKQLNSSTGASVANVFRANGIFDPDYTDTGHQAMYRDTYANIYSYYAVLGSKITVTFLSRADDLGFIVGIQGSETPTPSTSVTTWMEQNNGVHSLIGPRNSGPVTLFMTYSPVENLGSDIKDDNSSLTAVGSDPGSAQAYYFNVLGAVEDAVSTSQFTIVVEIEYTVKFSTLTKKTED